MICFRDGGCGPYEMRYCGHCGQRLLWPEEAE